MRTRTVWAVIALVVALTGCAAGEPEPVRAATGQAPPQVGEAAPATFLDGVWEADVPRASFLRYLMDHGVRRPDAVAAAEEDHMGRDFSVRFAEGMFNVTGPTGESWHQGDFEVRDDELLLWDEGSKVAGIPPFRLLVTRRGDTVQLEVAPGQAAGPLHRPGVPMLVAGGALWCAVPWRQVA